MVVEGATFTPILSGSTAEHRTFWILCARGREPRRKLPILRHPLLVPDAVLRRVSAGACPLALPDPQAKEAGPLPHLRLRPARHTRRPLPRMRLAYAANCFCTAPNAGIAVAAISARDTYFPLTSTSDKS